MSTAGLPMSTAGLSMSTAGLPMSTAGLPMSTLSHLKRLISAANRLFADLGPRHHVSMHIKRLHWLPNTYMIKFKLCIIMHDAAHG